MFLVLFCSCFLVKSVGESLLQCRISGYYDVTDGNGNLNSIILLCDVMLTEFNDKDVKNGNNSVADLAIASVTPHIHFCSYQNL